MPSNKSRARPSRKSATFRFEAIGTQWLIEIFDAPEDAEALLKIITARIDRFDKDYSRFRADSLVTTMSHEAGKYRLPADAKRMFDLYRELYEHTSGLMTPLIGQTLADAGYDAEYTFKPKDLQRPPEWDEILTYDFPFLVLERPVLLDLGAIGKGYLIDIIGDLLIDHGVEPFLINSGGDMLLRGSRTLEIALEHPEQTDEAIGIYRLHNQSLCGSAGNRRTWGKYHHIINPASLESPDSIKAVWVGAQSALLADALTTALFFVSPESLLKHYNFNYAIVYQDLSLASSKDFPAHFFASGE